MKQIIKKYDNNGSIRYKYYVNHLKQYNGLYIGYYTNGSICWKINWVNDKIFGIANSYNNNKPTNITYHL